MKNNHTFVICTYKDSPYLEECIRALECQTIKSDIIISTSTPTPNVEKLAELHNIPLYTHNQGGSIGKDWNYGFGLPKTKYVTIAHQDDIYLPFFLKTNIQNLDKNENSILAFTNYREIDENSEIKKRNKNLYIKDFMLIPFKVFNNNNFIRNRVLSLGSPICCPSVTYNKEKLRQFKFSESVSATVDWEAFYRINKKKGLWIYSSNRLMYHRIHAESETTNAIFFNKRTEEEKEMFRKYWPNLIADFLNSYYIKAQEKNIKKNGK